MTFTNKLILLIGLTLVTNNSLALIGNTNNGTATDIIGTTINAARFIANSNQSVSFIKAKVTGSGGKYKAAIYRGSSSAPSSFVVGSAEITPSTNGWYSFPLTQRVSLTNAQNYWLAIWSDNANSYNYYTSGGTVRWNSSLTTYGNWPATLATDGGGTFNYCIYADDTITTVNTNIATLIFDWPQAQNSIKYELYSTTNLLQSFSLFATVTGTNYITTYPKTNLPPMMFFRLYSHVASTNIIAGTNKSVTLAWGASPSSVAGYKIYSGGQSGEYTNVLTLGNVTTATITNLSPDMTYYFSSTAYDGSGLESLFSNEVLYSISAQTLIETNILNWPLRFILVK
jgi:hypothetical protein